MKNFFKDLSYNIKSWMRGRHGMDLLSYVLIIGAFILSFVSSALNASSVNALNSLGTVVGVMSTAAIIFGIFRAYSSNHQKRTQENEAFKRIFAGPINSIKIIKYRKKDQTHLYIKCPNCKTILRVPKGNGRIIITCPKCQNKVEVKS